MFRHLAVLVLDRGSGAGGGDGETMEIMILFLLFTLCIRCKRYLASLPHTTLFNERSVRCPTLILMDCLAYGSGNSVLRLRICGRPGLHARLRFGAAVVESHEHFIAFEGLVANIWGKEQDNTAMRMPSLCTIKGRCLVNHGFRQKRDWGPGLR